MSERISGTRSPSTPKSLSTHLDEGGHPIMVDVGGKEPTPRVAEAEGFVCLTDAITRAVREHATAKGDVLKVAELAGIMAAKRTPELIPLCHSIRLDNLRVECVLDEAGRRIIIRATVKAADVTGVEMEALTAVSVAALTIYDMCKGIDRGMSIGGIRLLRKSGGKSGDYVNPDAAVPVFSPHAQGHSHVSPDDRGNEARPVRAGVLTVSDRGAGGEREDTAGPALCELLSSWGAEVVRRDVVPDEPDAIIERVRRWIGEDGENPPHLILTTGGTGLSPRDVTPDALLSIADRTVPGMGEVMRAESLKHTPNAPLSRGLAVTVEKCLIAALPGSRNGAIQCFEALRPSLRHALEILNGWSREGDVSVEENLRLKKSP
ncbi:MAG: bifunctional molybdenum cofactor biosynthesis protein MoaC/MoaB [Synergistaceae bacterium]|jgi:molybdenum cofactor biosynthesis protein MoaC|nr:bifunctional molybdenum cofactor biosynthesis protein MoaC/MoaB [Synergistaceae bacterium]